MKFLSLNGQKELNVNINNYRIDWFSPSRSILQTRVKIFLHTYWKSHIVLEEFKIPQTRLKCDIINLNKKIAIEVQGDQHFAYNKFFHGSRSGYVSSIKRDMIKYNWLETNSFKVIELITEDVDKLSVDYIKERFGIFIP